MVGVIYKTIYKYENVELASGAVVTANEVTVKDGMIVSVMGSAAKVNEKTMSFSINSYGIDGELNYQINSPASIDGQAVVEEFVTFVLNDIA